MENKMQQFAEKLRKNGITLREEFGENASGITTGIIANSENEFFKVKVLKTEDGFIFEFQALQKNAVENGSAISIPDDALDETLPLFAHQVADREIRAQEIEKKLRAENLGKKVAAQDIARGFEKSMLDDTMRGAQVDAEKKQQIKRNFFEKLANREQITKQLFDGFENMTIQLPGKKKLPKINKLNLTVKDFQPEEESEKDTAATREALRKQQEFGLRDVQERQDKEDQENAQNAQKQKQIDAQKKKNAQKSSAAAVAAGIGIGAGATIGGTGLFALLFS